MTGLRKRKQDDIIAMLEKVMGQRSSRACREIKAYIKKQILIECIKSLAMK